MDDAFERFRCARPASARPAKKSRIAAGYSALPATNSSEGDAIDLTCVKDEGEEELDPAAAGAVAVNAGADAHLGPVTPALPSAPPRATATAKHSSAFVPDELAAPGQGGAAQASSTGDVAAGREGTAASPSAPPKGSPGVPEKLGDMHLRLILVSVLASHVAHDLLSEERRSGLPPSLLAVRDGRRS
jgi:hypothetical protein